MSDKPKPLLKVSLIQKKDSNTKTPDPHFHNSHLLSYFFRSNRLAVVLSCLSDLRTFRLSDFLYCLSDSRTFRLSDFPSFPAKLHPRHPYNICKNTACGNIGTRTGTFNYQWLLRVTLCIKQHNIVFTV